MAATKSRLLCVEVNSSSGVLMSNYVLSSTYTECGETVRIDKIPGSSRGSLGPGNSEKAEAVDYETGIDRSIAGTFASYIVDYLKFTFLPTCHVTEDYMWYQIYDSIQAFASSIAGLLSSRAVLQSFDIGSTSEDNNPTFTSVATAATLVSILQNTLANITSILFASHAASRINRDVKFYRFLADVVNDLAFVLDLLAPFASGHSLFLSIVFPLAPRTMILCASSMLRAICGVAGGSSKAVLSTHFANNNPEAVGDLQAKDSSQETVINLLGIWAGGYVVSKVEGFAATWCWMSILLAIHLFANYRAVQSLRLITLNRKRAGIVASKLCGAISSIQQDSLDSPSLLRSLEVGAIGRQEGVLGVREYLRTWWLNMWRQYAMGSEVFIGASLQDLVHLLNIGQLSHESSWTVSTFERLFAAFQKEAYVLWSDQATLKVIIVLKSDAQPQDHFKALLHAHVMQNLYLPRKQYSIRRPRTMILDDIELHLKNLNLRWLTICSKLHESGWDLSSTNLDEGKGVRLDVEG